jgi:hypothetical protein
VWAEAHVYFQHHADGREVHRFRLRSVCVTAPPSDALGNDLLEPMQKVCQTLGQQGSEY